MADRKVTHTGKDKDGDITMLCNQGMYWSPRLKVDAIRDIENNYHAYYVQWKDKRTGIHVVNDPKKGKYLRTDSDSTSKNNLDDLPNC